MSTHKRTYTKEFKQEALRLLETAESAASIERDLGITPGLLSRWNREQNQKGSDAFAGRGNVVGEIGEIQALKRRVALLEQERGILKKLSDVCIADVLSAGKGMRFHKFV